MKHHPEFIAATLVILLCSGTAHAAQTPNYPTKPIRLIVPFAAGGPMDIMSRAIGERLTTAWGQQVVIDNRGGAGGGIGVELAARSTPDGHTLLTGHIGTHAVNASLYDKLGYDPVKDFAPITLIATLPLGLFVHQSVPAKSVRDLIATAKARPGQINFATASSGGPTHMAAEMLKSMAGISIVHVPYKGNAAALNALVAGESHMMFSNLLTGMPHVRTGRLNVLAVSSGKRSPQAPDLPTIAESGVPGYDITPWYGILAPAGTPRAVVMKLNHEVVRIVESPEMKSRFVTQGVDLTTSTPEEFADLIRTEIPKWRKIVRDSGASVG
ncbi:MAG: tripartite tricarboxylate transporter substrate binding protein [Burkholderiales bacterium]|nr:tripartite tricarboxylate transporter substrate binding protein [Burkholderiales bacterium]